MVNVARFSVRAAIAFVLVIGAVAGIAAVLWRMPMTGVDTQPPVCWSTFGNVVACGSEGSAFGFAVTAVLASGAITYVVARRLRARSHSKE